MIKKTIPYGKQSLDRADIEAVIEVLKSDFLTTGPWVEKFEQELCAQTGAKYAVACSNGTTALHLACRALGIGPESLGLTTPITFLASANCIEFCGAKTGFVDIDTNTLCLSPGKLEEYCKNNRAPDVVIPVDFAGVPADLPALHALSQRFGFKLIEDAAHAIGSTYVHEGRDYQCGSCAHTDLAIFSFHPVKTITTGEGGAVLTNSPHLAAKLKLLRSHGMTKDPNLLTRLEGPWYYEMHTMGYNYRITDIQCALGLSQLKKLPGFKNRRQEIVKAYNKAFTGNNALILPPWSDTTSPCFHLYPIQFAEGSAKRAAMYEMLKNSDILTQVHYFPVHLQPYYAKKYGFAEGDFPNAENYYSGCLSLPLYPAMSDGDVTKVIELMGTV